MTKWNATHKDKPCKEIIEADPPVRYGRQQHMAKAAMVRKMEHDPQNPQEVVPFEDIQDEEIGDNLFDQAQAQVTSEDILPTTGMGMSNLATSSNQYAVFEDSSDSEGTAEF